MSLLSRTMKILELSKAKQARLRKSNMNEINEDKEQNDTSDKENFPPNKPPKKQRCIPKELVLGGVISSSSASKNCIESISKDNDEHYSLSNVIVDASTEEKSEVFPFVSLEGSKLDNKDSTALPDVSSKEKDLTDVSLFKKSTTDMLPKSSDVGKLINSNSVALQEEVAMKKRDRWDNSSITETNDEQFDISDKENIPSSIGPPRKKGRCILKQFEGSNISSSVLDAKNCKDSPMINTHEDRLHSKVTTEQPSTEGRTEMLPLASLEESEFDDGDLVALDEFGPRSSSSENRCLESACMNSSLKQPVCASGVADPGYLAICADVEENFKVNDRGEHRSSSSGNRCLESACTSFSSKQPVRASGVADPGYSAVCMDVEENFKVKDRGEQVGFYNGSIVNVYFVASPSDHDFKVDTRTIYVVNETLPALCFKIQSASCLIGHLQEFSILEWEKMTGTKLNDTVVLSKNISGDGCRVTDKQELASNFPNRRALIITRLPIQPKYQLHSGWLWSCGDCCKGNTIMCNLKKHIEKEEHNFFFPNNRPPKVWGKEKHRSRTKVWGEPDNTSKTKPFVFERESMVKVQTSKAIATEETNGPVIHLPKNPVVTESMNSQSTPEMTTEVQSFEAIAPEDAISPVTHSPTIPVETESMDSRSTPKLTIEAVELDTNSNILPEKKDNAHSSQVDIEEIRTLVCCELCDEEVNTNLLEEHLRVCHDLTQKSYYDSFSLSRSVVAKQDHDNLPTRKSSRLLDKGPVQYDLSEDEFLLDDSEEEVICNSEEEDSEDEYESDKDYVKHKKQSTKSTKSSGPVTCFPDSDSEEEVDVDMENERNRKKNQQERREQMLKIFNEAPKTMVYIPVGVELDWEKRLLTRHTQINSHKFSSLSLSMPPDVRLSMAEGDVLTGKNTKYQPGTTVDCRNAMRRLLVDIEVEQNRLFEGKLPNGKMQYRYCSIFFCIQPECFYF